MINAMTLAIANPTLAHGAIMLLCLLLALALACFVFAAFAWDEKDPRHISFAEGVGLLGTGVMFCASFMQWGWF